MLFRLMSVLRGFVFGAPVDGAPSVEPTWYAPTTPRGWTSAELLARIAADTTDADVDRHLPPSLRRYGR